MMNIRDSVFKDIEISELEEKIIDDPNFQRLRYVKQGGFSSLVFPSASGSRFEHSIGTMKITKDISKSVFGEEDEELSLCGMLHDIGHAPFSHQSEPIAKKYLGKSHEDLGYEIIKKSSISDIISDSTVSLNKVLEYFSGKGKGKLVTGPLGSDRIDYLLHDSYNTGVALGIIDYSRLEHNMAYVDGKPAIYRNGIVNAESFFITRYFMYESVYMHHTISIVESMFLKAADSAVEDGYIKAEEFVKMRDFEALYKLSQYKGSDLIDRILRRDVFKRAFYEDIGQAKFDESQLSKLNEYLESNGIPYNSYISKLISFSGADDDIIIVGKGNEKIGKLSEYSYIFNTLSKLLRERKILLVASDKNYKEKIAKLVKEFINSE
ncbi:HD superfamily phosphohydrolase [Candidatus Mancarchaeum acidiphilum]|uniref:HD superfamily phosphohydrolase n=1 Tax=Candidatus Mancarchaeum acidiphilum TaxID=1920749 RepID=A0A218NLL1_9ARCH|nr:HD domain-containing protein [Candidatus Mancarchaeum acidiphilum]ASI13359.1 HD superfamily phosphohydrolase [Candidatus Mancarchaeum acidiphilum]